MHFVCYRIVISQGSQTDKINVISYVARWRSLPAVACIAYTPWKALGWR